MIHVMDYLDYHQYLRDYYEARKQDDQFMSYRFFGEKTGIDPGYLYKVLQGKLELARKSVPIVCKYIGLNEKEAEYFELLVRYSKAKTPLETKVSFESLLALRTSRAKRINPTQYAFYQKWYHSAIHALLSVYPFQDDFKELANQLSPKISVAQARESVHLLKQIGLIRLAKNGCWEPVEMQVTTGEKWESIAIQENQKQSIQLSMDALDHCPKELRDISTLTVALSMRDLPEIRERIAQLRHAILNLDNENEPDTVFQINFQVIPVSKTQDANHE